MLRKRGKVIIKLLALGICVNLVHTTNVFAEEKVVNEGKIIAATDENKSTKINNELFNSSITKESDFEFDVNTGTITKYIGTETAVVIPNKINGISVKSIGEKAFWNCGIDLKSVKIPNSVTSIEKDAFNSCRSLKDIVVPNSVTSIGKDAFGGCNSFSKITVPNSVKSIERGAFNNCKNLKSITLPNGLTSIEDSVFWGCTNLTSIKIPNSVTSIGNDSFNCCYKLTSINIPNGVTSIGKDAFGGCGNLKSVNIPNSVTAIGVGAFNYCSSLKNIAIPSSVTSIGNGAFYACDNTVFNIKSEEIKQLLINVNVSENKIILGGQSSAMKATSVKLNKKNLNLLIGKTEKLTVTIAPSKAINKDVTWQSSNLDVATVDSDGNVLATGIGETTITCTANHESGKAASCVVKVNEPQYLNFVYPNTDGFSYLFEGVNVVFDNNIKVPTDWSGIKVTNSSGIEIPISRVHTTISKKELQMNCPSITNGEYTLFIPANTISDVTGKKYNKEINFKFNIKLSLELRDDKRKSYQYTFKGINLNFMRDINVPEDWTAIKVKNSQGIEVPITAVNTTVSTKELQIHCESMTNGQYILIIPAGTISDVTGQMYNEDINIKFTVKLKK